MDITVIIFLTSGLFLGWALGANHLGNVFGTAVGTRMIRFSTAAAICSVFVVLGAVFGGGGTAETIGKLGAVNTLAGAFMVALAAAGAVWVMTRAGLPVSTTHAIVGAIIGWNVFSETWTDFDALIKITIGWVLGPILAALFAIALFFATVRVIRALKLHLLYLDAYTRLGLILAGAFGAYSLGANNIANVVGVFLPASPFVEFRLFDLFTVSPAQQLFLLGGIAIAVGVYTYSEKVVHTVGRGLYTLSPVSAWVVVMAHSLVLFLFASEGLERLLAHLGLPTIPLVPISSSEVIVGAVLGVALVKGRQNIRWRTLGRIGVGWAMTPAIAGIVCFFGLFILQNVFNQNVYDTPRYQITPAAAERLGREGLPPTLIARLAGQTFESSAQLESSVASSRLSRGDIARILEASQIDAVRVEPLRLGPKEFRWLTAGQMYAVYRIAGQPFPHRWAFAEALARESQDWRPGADAVLDKPRNRALHDRVEALARLFRDR
ncbi:MAG: inorganic phosphate transporter [Rhodospirillales bacterium]|nr:inorganic phosphate transporter [Rhodospirillales bacterium]